MNIYESLLSPTFVLNEQIARQLFEVLPEQGPTIILMDRNGHRWPSNSEEFARLNLSDSHFQDLCAKIDDGDEPVITQVNECSLIAAQLATEWSNCGYVIIVLPHYSAESTLVNINLIETLLLQFNLIAKLLEKINLLHDLQRQSRPERIPREISLN